MDWESAYVLWNASILSKGCWCEEYRLLPAELWGRQSCRDVQIGDPPAQWMCSASKWAILPQNEPFLPAWELWLMARGIQLIWDERTAPRLLQGMNTTQDNRPRDTSVAHLTWKSLNDPLKPPCRVFSTSQIQPRQGKAALHLSSFKVSNAGKSPQERKFPLFSFLRLQQPETKLTGFLLIYRQFQTTGFTAQLIDNLSGKHWGTAFLLHFHTRIDDKAAEARKQTKP